VAQVVPFRGLYFNPAQIPDLTQVVTPPYDVISPAQRADFAARHPHNMVHLILPQTLPGDNRLHNRYTRTAALFREWLRRDVFLRDPEPAYYYWETEFQHQGRTFVRRAFAALVRLEPFSRGVILPHEQTFSQIKEDRLELIKHSRAHFSPIFSLFPDPQDDILREMERLRPDDPLVHCTDAEGRLQRLYRLTEPRRLQSIFQALAPLPLYIADGHHRYETALAFQKWMKDLYPQAGPRAPFHYVLMYLANLYDTELVILMAHRMLGGRLLKRLEEGRLLTRLEDYFQVTPLPRPAGEAGAYELLIQQQLDAADPADTVFVFLGFGLKAWRLQLRPGVRQELLAQQMHPALAQLDVAVLNYLIFDRILGLDAKALDDPETCTYDSKIPEVLAALQERRANCAFFLNPTKIEQVRQVAEAGLIMPRKSTYFYPKVMTGLILNPLNTDEEMTLPEA